MRKAPGNAIKLAVLPSGITAKRAGALLSALVEAERTVDGEHKLHLYTLADGGIGVYKHRYQDWE